MSIFFTRIQFTNVLTSLRTLRTPWCWVVGCLALLVLPLPKILSCGFLCSHCLQPTGFLPLPPTSPTYLPSFTNNIMSVRSWARFLRCEPASISSTFTISTNNYPTLRFRSLAATQPGWAELCICLLCPRGTENQLVSLVSTSLLHLKTSFDPNLHLSPFWIVLGGAVRSEVYTHDYQI